MKKSYLKILFMIFALNFFSSETLLLRAQTIDLEEDLILYLPFNGSATDISGNNFPAMTVGPVLTNDRFGNPDQAYLFDGQNDQIILNNNQAIITESAFTIAMWARIDGRSQVEPRYNNTLFEHRNDDPSESSGIHFAAERIINTQLELRSSSGSSTISLQTDYPGDGTWYHYAAILDEDNYMYLYINGELKASRQYNSNGDFHSGVNRVNIGTHHTGGLLTGAFNGAIDDVFIYNRALNYCEIETLYSGQLLRER